MKKTFLIAVVVLVFALLPAGCGNTNIGENLGGYEKLYDFDLSGYVELGQYKGLEITGATDESVRFEMIAGLILLGAYDELTDVGIEAFDLVNIDLAGTVDGAPFERGSAEGYELLIGSGLFIPGLEDGLIGGSTGDEILLNLTFPDSYDDVLAGQDVEFSVIINSVKRAVVADEAVRSMSSGEFGGVAEYEAYVRDNLNNSIKFSRADYLWEKVMENSRIIDYPEKELRGMIDEIEKYFRDEAAQAGLTWEDYLRQGDVTQAEADEAIMERAREEVGREMITCAIAALEGLEVTEEEYDGSRLGIMADMGYQTEELFKRANGGKTLEEVVGKSIVEMRLLHSKVLAFICEHAVIK